MENFIINCPKCGHENPIDIFKVVDESHVLCRGCNEFIILKFEGKTPKQIIENINYNI
jgi:DNA-directed RNA polymerase subunit RPC12/RpoP